jgi:hypothetical protein
MNTDLIATELLSLGKIQPYAPEGPWSKHSYELIITLLCLCLRKVTLFNINYRFILCNSFLNKVYLTYFFAKATPSLRTLDVSTLLRPCWTATSKSTNVKGTALKRSQIAKITLVHSKTRGKVSPCYSSIRNCALDNSKLFCCVFEVHKRPQTHYIYRFRVINKFYQIWTANNEDIHTYNYLGVNN